MRRPIEIFCCATDRDRFFLERLTFRLTPQIQQGIITLWNKSQIQLHMISNAEIQQHLANADIFLLLISNDFLADDYCYNIVMRTALERYSRGEAIPIPVIVRPTNWQNHELARHLQPLLRNDQPICNMENQEQALGEVIYDIHAAIQSLEIADVSPYPSASSHMLKLNASSLPTSQAVALLPRSKGATALLGALVCLLIITLAFFVPFSRNLFARNPGTSTHTILVSSSQPAPTSGLPPGGQQSGNDDPSKNNKGNALSSSPALSPTASSSPISSASPVLSLPPILSPPPEASSASNLIPAGQATISDPLKDNSEGYAWDTVNTNHGSCNFTQGEYLLTVPAGTSNGVGCNMEASKGIFTNFVYQIQMTILAGMNNDQSGAGLTFRVNTSGNGRQYQVTFDGVGDWQVAADATVLTSNDTSCANPCPYFHRGLNQPNFITVRASGNIIQVQINGSSLGTYVNGSYASGFIGVQVASGTEDGSVAFSNLRLWVL